MLLYGKRDNTNAGRCTKSGSKKNNSHKRKYHGKKKRECDENNKTDVQAQNVVKKNNLQDTGLSTEILSSSLATVCSSKIIDIEMDPSASLSLPVTASSPISGYRLIDMSVLADAFMLLSCPECDSIHYLKLCDIRDKQKPLQDFCNSFASKLCGAADSAHVGVSVGSVKGSHPWMELYQPYLLIVKKSLIKQFYLKVAKAVPECRR